MELLCAWDLMSTFLVLVVSLEYLPFVPGVFHFKLATMQISLCTAPPPSYM